MCSLSTSAEASVRRVLTTSMDVDSVAVPEQGEPVTVASPEGEMATKTELLESEAIKAASLEDLVAEVVARHPSLVQAALEKVTAAEAVAASSKLCSEESSAPPVKPEAKGQDGAVPATDDSKPVTTRAGPAPIPNRRYCPLFWADSAYQQRELEKLAAAFMDGYENGATWVLEDRRSGTVIDFNEVNGCGNIEEDDTQQPIFVNRRAVKRLAEPRWRHSLRPG